jgi:peptide/nickel transport system substrate-binding protein
MLIGVVLFAVGTSACSPATPQAPTAPPPKPTEAPKPAEKSAATPAATAAPAEKPAEAKPALSKAEGPAAQPAASPAAKPTEAAAQKAEAKPAEKPAAKPALSKAEGPAAAPAGKVTIAIAGEPTSLDPQFRDDGNERAINDNVFETLIARDRDMKLVPGLAEKWEQVNPTTWRFSLRKGVKFHNGEDFNAQAVEHSIKRISAPEFKSTQSFIFETLQGTRVVDESTVEVMTKGPDPIITARLAWLKLVPPRASANQDFTEKPVGTGPYKFLEWRRGQMANLTANDTYWGGMPKIKDATIRFIPEANTRLAALRAGEVDLIRDLFPEQAGQAPKVERVAGLEFPVIRLNAKAGPTADPRVRQAMNYAIDKEAIARATYGGFAEVAPGQVLNDREFGFNPNVKAYPYDVNRARQLLQEAGQTSFEIAFIGTGGRWLKDKEVVEAVAGQLERVGIRSKITVLEFSQYVDAMLAKENQPGAGFISISSELLDADKALSFWFHCKSPGSLYCNEEVTSLIDGTRTETDVRKREQMYHRAVELINREAAAIFLVNPQDAYGLTQRLQWKPRPDAKIQVWDMSLGQ